MVSAAVNRMMCQKVQRRKKPGLSGRAGEVGREAWTENGAIDLRFLKTQVSRGTGLGAEGRQRVVQVGEQHMRRYRGWTASTPCPVNCWSRGVPDAWAEVQACCSKCNAEASGQGLCLLPFNILKIMMKCITVKLPLSSFLSTVY